MSIKREIFDNLEKKFSSEFSLFIDLTSMKQKKKLIFKIFKLRIFFSRFFGYLRIKNYLFHVSFQNAKKKYGNPILLRLRFFQILATTPAGDAEHIPEFAFRQVE